MDEKLYEIAGTQFTESEIINRYGDEKFRKGLAKGIIKEVRAEKSKSAAMMYDISGVKFSEQEAIDRYGEDKFRRGLEKGVIKPIEEDQKDAAMMRPSAPTQEEPAQKKSPDLFGGESDSGRPSIFQTDATGPRADKRDDKAAPGEIGVTGIQEAVSKAKEELFLQSAQKQVDYIAHERRINELNSDLSKKMGSLPSELQDVSFTSLNKIDEYNILIKNKRAEMKPYHDIIRRGDTKRMAEASEKVSSLQQDINNYEDQIKKIELNNIDASALASGYTYTLKGRPAKKSNIIEYITSYTTTTEIRELAQSGKPLPLEIQGDVELQKFVDQQYEAAKTNLLQRAASGLSATAASIAGNAGLVFFDERDRIGMGIYKLFGASDEEAAKKYFGDDLGGRLVEEYNQSIQKEQGMELGEFIKMKSAEELSKQIDVIRGKRMVVDGDVVDMIMNGQIADALRASTEMAIESAPYMAAAATPAGTAMMFGSISYPEYLEARKEGVGVEKAFTGAVSSSTVEIVDNLLSVAFAKQAMTQARKMAISHSTKAGLGTAATRDFVTESGKIFIDGLKKEMPTEFAQGGGAELIRQWTYGEDIDMYKAGRMGVIESMAVGPTTTVVTSPAVLNVASTTFKEWREGGRKVNAVMDLLTEAEMPENRSVAKELRKEAINIIKAEADFLSKRTEAVKSATSEQQEQLKILTLEEESIAKSLSSPSISDKTREFLEGRQEDVENQKSGLLQEIERQAIALQEEQKRQAEKAAEAAKRQADGVVEVVIDKPTIVVNSKPEIDKVISAPIETKTGQTFNSDGTVYSDGGLVIPIVSENLTQEELTPERVADFTERHKNKIGSEAVKVGIYKFPNSNQVSIDLNIVVPRSNRDVGVEFGRIAGQESLFDLDTRNNVETGADGSNPMTFTDEQFKEIARALEEGRMPNLEQQQQTDEKAKQEEPMLEGVSDGGDQKEGAQDGAELRTEEATQKEVEAKKADIERRRQEELKNRKGNTISQSEVQRIFLDRRDNNEQWLYFNKKADEVGEGRITEESNPELYKELVEAGVKPFKEGISRLEIFEAQAQVESELKKEVNKEVKEQGLKRVTDEFRFQDDTKKIKEINAKYDAELKALEQQTEQNKKQSEDEQAKPGNRLFNKPLEGVSKIADRYYERVFGKKRPKYRGSRKLDRARAKRISDAFEAMANNPNDPMVRRAYEAMAKEVIDQYQAFIDAGYKVEINNEEPYGNSAEMIEDLRSRKVIKIFSTESGFGDTPITDQQRQENPLLRDSGFKDMNGQTMLINDLFRAVHDFFGHAELGNSFGPKGEENAWNVHARMFSPLARAAMTTETRGQNSYVNFSGVNERVEAMREEARKLRDAGDSKGAEEIVQKIYEEMSFADQKVGLLPEEFYEVDETDTGDVQTTNQQQDAIQEPKTEEVPLQPEAGGSQEVQQAQQEGGAQEGGPDVQEEVAEEEVKKAPPKIRKAIRNAVSLGKVRAKGVKGLYAIYRKQYAMPASQAAATALVSDRLITSIAKRIAKKDGISFKDAIVEAYRRIQFADKKSFEGMPAGVRFQLGALHGSPYLFPKFTTEAIGTGEGAQAFGWGLYFTDLESVARNYAEKLRPVKTVGSTYIDGKNTPLYEVRFKDGAGAILDPIRMGSSMPANLNLKIQELNRVLSKHLATGREEAVINELKAEIEALAKEHLKNQPETIRRQKELANKRAAQLKELNSMSDEKLLEVASNYDNLSEEDQQDAVIRPVYHRGKLDAAKIRDEALFLFNFFLGSEKGSSYSEDLARRANEFEIFKDEVYPWLVKNIFNIDLNNIENTKEPTYLYKVTLHKGKAPGEYTWLEWDKPVSEDQIKRIKSQAQKEGISIGNLRRAKPKEATRVSSDGSGRFVYSYLSDVLGSDKEASLFLLRAGIDGTKYPAESIARGATSDTARGFNYVVFDENAVSIEEVIRFQSDSWGGWKSTAAEGVSKVQQKSATPEQWVKMISDKGGKGTSQELEWIGLSDYLSDWAKENNSKSVPKEVVEQYINDNKIEIVEVSKGKPEINIEDLDAEFDGSGFVIRYNGRDKIIAPYITLAQIDLTEEDTYEEDFDYYSAQQDAKQAALEEMLGREDGEVKYSKYTLEGGSNYREVLLTLPSKRRATNYTQIAKELGYGDISEAEYGRLPKEDRDRIKTERENRIKEKSPFASSHWDESNILAHLRINERTLPNGERVMFIEEVQSDWAQEGKREGFSVPENKAKIKELEASKQGVLNSSESYRILNNKTNGDLGIDVFNAIQQQATMNIDNPYSTPESRKSSFLEKINETIEYWSRYQNVPDMSSAEWSDFYDNYIAELQDNSTRTPGYTSSYRLASIQNEIFAIETEIIDNREKSGVPNMPYKKTDQWVGMAMRRAMQMAAQEGFDRVAWVTGEQSAERYDLSKQVDTVGYNGKKDGTYDVVVKDLDGRDLLNKNMTIDEIESTLGKEIADKIQSNEYGDDISTTDAFERQVWEENGYITEGVLEGENLKVGGEGMGAFYNSILPKVAKKEAQRFDKKAKVEVVDFAPELTKDEDAELTRLAKKADESGVESLSFEEQERLNELAAKEGRTTQLEQGTRKQLSIAITPEMRMNLNSAIPLFQSARGAMLMKSDVDAVIFALTDPNVSTPLHELAHVFEHYLTDQEKDDVLKSYAEATGDNSGVWSVGVSEYFARGFEKYLSDGVAPTDALKKIFELFKEWLTDIYKGVIGSDIDVKLNDKMKAIYDSMLTGQAARKSTKAPSTRQVTRQIQKKKIDRDKLKDAFDNYVKQVNQVMANIRAKIDETKKERNERIDQLKKEYKDLQAQMRQAVKDLKDDLKQLAREQKDDKAAVNALAKAVRDRAKSLGLKSTSQKTLYTMIEGFKKVDRNNLNDYIDEVVDQLKAEWISKQMKQADSLWSKVNKKNKKGDYGNLATQVNSLLAIPPGTIPENLIVEYVDLLTRLQKVFSPKLAVNVSEEIGEFFRKNESELDSQAGLLEELKKEFARITSQNQNLTTNKERLDKLKENATTNGISGFGVVSEEDFDYIVSVNRKAIINAATVSTPKTKNETAERQNELTKLKAAGRKVDIRKFKDEVLKSYITYVNRATDAEILELTSSEIKALRVMIAHANNGMINKTFIRLAGKLDGIHLGEDMLSSADNINATTAAAGQMISKMDEIRMAREQAKSVADLDATIQKMLNKSANMLGRLVKKMSGSKIYTLAINKYTSARDKVSTDVNKVKTELNDMFYSMSTSFGGPVYNSALLSLYFRVREKALNPNELEIGDPFGYIVETIKDSSTGKSKVEALSILAEKYFDGYDKLDDNQKLVKLGQIQQEILSEIKSRKGGEIISYMDKIVEQITPKAKFLAEVVTGKPWKQYTGYQPRTTAARSSMNPDEIAAERVKKYTRASTKSKRIDGRQAGDRALTFDAIGDFIDLYEDVNMHYEVSLVMSRIASMVNHVKKKGDKKMKLAADVIERYINQDLSSSVVSDKKRPGFLDRAVSRARKNIVTSILSGYVAKLPADTASMFLKYFLYSPVKYIQNMSALRKVKSELKGQGYTTKDILSVIGSTHKERAGVYHDEIYQTVSSLVDQVRREGYSKNMFERINQKFAVKVSKSKKLRSFKRGTSMFAEAPIRLPDKMTTSVYVAGEFINKFEELSGRKLDANKLMNDANYRAANKRFIDEARGHADKIGSRFGNIGTIAERAISARNTSAIEQIKTFMWSFPANESENFYAALESLWTGEGEFDVGAGKAKTRISGIAYIMSQSVSMVTYQVFRHMIMNAVLNQVMGFIFGTSDSDDDEETKVIKKALYRGFVDAALTNFFGRQKLFARLATMTAVDAAVMLAAELSEDEDMKETFTMISDSIYGLSRFTSPTSMVKQLGGPYGIMFDVAYTMYEYTMDKSEGKKPEIPMTTLAMAAGMMMALPAGQDILSVLRRYEMEKRGKSKKGYVNKASASY